MLNLLNALVFITLTVGLLNMTEEYDFTHNLRIAPQAGLFIPETATIQEDSAWYSIQSPGPVFGFEVQYRINPAFSLNGGYSYGWSSVDVSGLDSYTQRPAFVTSRYTLTGQYRFGQSQPESRSITPVLFGGLGGYRWELTNDRIFDGGVPVPSSNNEVDSDLAPGLIAGSALEWKLSEQVSLFGKGAYNVFFTDRDNPLQGTQGDFRFWSVDVGIAFSSGKRY